MPTTVNGDMTSVSPPEMVVKKKTKTFTGCSTCRSRKIKCDLGRPSCQRCEKSGLVCAGYQIVLCWSRPLEFDKYGRQLRNSIFSEDETAKGFKRRSIEFVKYKREYELYDEMDRDLAVVHSPEHYHIQNHVTMLQGPFGVFEGNLDPKSSARRKRRRTKGRQLLPPIAETEKLPVSLKSVTPTSSIASSLPLASNSTLLHGNKNELRGKSNKNNASEWLSNELRFDALLSATAATSNDQNNYFFEFLYPYNENGRNKAQNESSLNVTEGHDILPFDQQVFNALKPQDNHEQITTTPFENLHNNSNIISSSSTPIMTTPKNSLYYLFNSNDLNISENIIQIVETKTFPDLPGSLNIPTSGVKISPLTQFLLNNYYTEVADKMTVVPFDSNPWKKIYLPRAISALGDLAALGRTSNSRLSVLHAILAVSCFGLQSKFAKTSPEMKFFLNLGIEFRAQASNFLKKVFRNGKDTNSLFDSKSEKYKDVLVSILSMNTIDVVWGTMADCEYYLSLCETIISKRTSERPQLSNKAKILHRVFSFLKLLQDSTNLKKLSSINHELKLKFLNKLAEAMNNDENTEFYENVDPDGMIEIGFINKAMTIGEYKPKFIDEKTSSISRENKHVFLTDSLYGLPNSLILLFTETVKMIQVKFLLDKDPVDSDLQRLHQLSSNFEKKLLNWKTEWKLRKDNSLEFLSALHEGIYHHSMGFYNALIIYYFTMIQDKEHKYLQIYSNKCIDHLEDVQRLIDSGETQMQALIWQGFIAGCSAIGPELQDRYRIWTSNLAKSGVGSYWGARQIMFEVWRRREKNESNDNWLSVHKDWEMNIMLS